MLSSEKPRETQMHASSAMRNTTLALPVVFATPSVYLAAAKTPPPVPPDDIAPIQALGQGDRSPSSWLCIKRPIAASTRQRSTRATTGNPGGSAATATYARASQENMGDTESVKSVPHPSQIHCGRSPKISLSIVNDPTLFNRSRDRNRYVLPVRYLRHECRAAEARHGIHCAA